jgi:hypothetical protein
MDFKKEIESILKELKEAGIDRNRIVKDLGYSKNYIDQVLSKGGNKKFLGKLNSYAKKVLPNAVSNKQDQYPSIDNTDSVEPELRKKWTSEIDVSSLIKTLLEEKDHAIKKAEESEKKWETLCQDVIKENSKLLDIISDILKGNLSADNLNHINQQLSQLNNQTHIASDQIEQPKKVSGTKKDSEKKNKGN